MMAPEDVLIEAMQAAERFGDSPELRAQMCAKLIKSIHAHGYFVAVPCQDAAETNH